MFNKLKLVAKHSLIYGLGNILNRIVGLILLPLYTDKLTTAEYGGVGIAEVTSQVIITFFGFSLYRALERFYWDKHYADKKKSIFFTVFICLIFFSICIYICSLFFDEFLARVLFGSSDYAFLVKLVVISSGITIVNESLMSLIRLQQKSVLFTTSNFFRFFTILLLTFIFLEYYNKKIEGIYEALIFGQTVFILSLSWFILKNFEYRFELSILKEMMKFSAPLIASSLSLVMISSIDRYSLRILCDFKDVGLYTLGFKIANTIKVLFNKSIQLAVGPIKFKMMNEPDNKRFYSKIATYIALIIMFIIITISLFSKEIIILLSKSPDYNNAYIYVPVLTMALYFDIIRRNMNIGLLIKKKTNIIASTIIIMSFVNLGLNFSLIYLIGPYGAAIANLCTQIIFFTIIYRFNQKYYPIKYELNKLIKLAIIGSLLMTSMPILNEIILIYRIFIKGIIVIIIFPASLYFWNFFDKIELIRTKETLHKLLNKFKNIIINKS